MKYRDRIKQNVERLTSEERSALIAFQQEIQEPDSPTFDQQYYHQWIHEKNPHKRADGSQLWIYRKDGVVQGQQVGIPFSLSILGKSYQASWSVGLLVRPEFRMRGIGNVLSDIHRQDSDVTVAIGVSDEAHCAYLRAGWIDLGNIPVFIRPLDAKRMLPLFGRSSDNFTARTSAGLCNALLRVLDLGCNLVSRFSDVELEPVSQFDQRVDQVWEVAKSSYPFLAERDCKSLQWRFDNVAESQDYQRFYLRKGGNISGYIVVRNSMLDSVLISTIVDFLCPPSLVTPLMAKYISTLRRSSVAAVYCRAVFPDATRRLYPLGFCKRHSFTRIMASLNKKAGLARELMSNRSEWFITTADSDGDYHEAGSNRNQPPVVEEKSDILVPSHGNPGKVSLL